MFKVLHIMIGSKDTNRYDLINCVVCVAKVHKLAKAHKLKRLLSCVYRQQLLIVLFLY